MFRVVLRDDAWTLHMEDCWFNSRLRQQYNFILQLFGIIPLIQLSLQCNLCWSWSSRDRSGWYLPVLHKTACVSQAPASDTIMHRSACKACQIQRQRTFPTTPINMNLSVRSCWNTGRNRSLVERLLLLQSMMTFGGSDVMVMESLTATIHRPIWLHFSVLSPARKRRRTANRERPRVVHTASTVGASHK